MIERAKGETEKAWQAFLDFRDLGASRSTKFLIEKYLESDGKKEVPTKSHKSLYQWRWRHRWDDRVAEWDAEQERLKIAAKDEEQQKQWEQEVEACRVRTKKAAQSLMELAITVMRDLTQDIKEGRLTTQDRVRLAPVLSKYIEQASSLEGTALGIAQLLEERDNS